MRDNCFPYGPRTSASKPDFPMGFFREPNWANEAVITHYLPPALAKPLRHFLGEVQALCDTCPGNLGFRHARPKGQLSSRRINNHLVNSEPHLVLFPEARPERVSRTQSHSHVKAV